MYEAYVQYYYVEKFLTLENFPCFKICLCLVIGFCCPQIKQISRRNDQKRLSESAKTN